MGVHPFIGLEKYGSCATQNAGRLGKLAELVKPFAMSKPDDLSLIFGTQVLKRENSEKLSPGSMHALWHTHIQTHRHAHRHTQSLRKYTYNNK